MLFRKKNKKKLFNLKLEFVESHDLLLRKSTNCKGFIYINKTIQEFIEENTCKILLFSSETSSNIVVADLIFENSEILISDLYVDPVYQNQGYGTEVLQSIVHVSKNAGAIKIDGYLSIKDLDHKDQLEHFYTNQVFYITKFKNNSSNFGKIELPLNN